MKQFGQNMSDSHLQQHTDGPQSIDGVQSSPYKKTKNGGISKNIIRYPGFSLDLFFFVPLVMIKRGDLPISTVNLNPVLRLVAKPPMGITYTSDRAFRITPRDLPLVVRFFKEVVFWFDDPKRENLFVIDNNEDLVFNYDYESLRNAIALPTYTSIETMKAVPDVICRNDKARAEGIRLMVNKTENVITMTYPELYTLYKILDKFDFTTESAMTYLLVSTLIKKGKYEFSTNKYD